MELNDPRDWLDRKAVGANGAEIGTIQDIYYDNDTRRPEWLLVSRGLLGMKESLAPIAGARLQGEAVKLPFTKDEVKSAPDIDADREISEEEEDRLFTHYGIIPSAGEPAAAEGSMVRTEETLDTGAVRRPRELVRLRKEVSTEHVQRDVPVAREEISVEREPITDDEAADIDQGRDEVTMVAYEEEPVAQKRVVPKERVSLSRKPKAETETVEADLRKEEVEVERDKP